MEGFTLVRANGNGPRLVTKRRANCRQTFGIDISVSMSSSELAHGQSANALANGRIAGTDLNGYGGIGRGW